MDKLNQLKKDKKLSKDSEKRLMVLRRLPAEVLNFQQTTLGLSLSTKFKVITKQKYLKEVIVHFKVTGRWVKDTWPVAEIVKIL